MRSRLSTAVTILVVGLTSPTHAQDPLLEETVGLTGAILYQSLSVPGLVIGAVRNGKTAVAGFGEGSRGVGRPPDGETLMRIDSITKVFAGTALASLAAAGTVRLSDPLDKHLDWNVAVPVQDGRLIRLIDLATHTSGPPRKVERDPSPPENPMRTLTREAFIANSCSSGMMRNRSRIASRPH